MSIGRGTASSSAASSPSATAAAADADGGVVDINGSFEEHGADAGSLGLLRVFRPSEAHVSHFLFPVVTQFDVKLAELLELLVKGVFEVRIGHLLVEIAHKQRLEVGRPFRLFRLVRTAPTRTPVRRSIVAAAIRPRRRVEGRATTGTTTAAAAAVVITMGEIVSGPITVRPGKRAEPGGERRAKAQRVYQLIRQKGS